MAQPFDFGIDRSAFFARFVQYLLFLPIVFDALSENEDTLGEAR